MTMVGQKSGWGKLKSVVVCHGNTENSLQHNRNLSRDSFTLILTFAQHYGCLSTHNAS